MSEAPTRSSGRAGLRLPEPGDVHLWWADLRASEPALDRLRGCLDSGEIERARQLRYAEDGAAYVARHGYLRSLLSRYLDIPPDHLRFASTERGKPSLVGGREMTRLRFNLSHSRGLALYGVSSGRAIGVDIESLREIDIGPLLTSRIFAARELATLGELPAAERAAAFYRFWTLKEAFVKATGAGIGVDLAEIDVSAAVIGREAIRLPPAGRAWWSLVRVDVRENYQAAIAIEGALRRINVRQWPADLS